MEIAFGDFHDSFSPGEAIWRCAPERRGRRSLRFPVTESVKNRSFGFGFLATSLKMAETGTFAEITVANLWKMGYNGGKFKNYAHLGWR